MYNFLGKSKNLDHSLVDMPDVSKSKAKNNAIELASGLLDKEDISVDIAVGGDSNYTFLIDEKFVIKIEKRESWKEEMLREPAILDLLKDQENVKTPTIIDSGYKNGLFYRIMHYIQGETLDKYSEGRNFHRLKKQDKKLIAYRIGEKLAQVHSLETFNRFGVLETEDRKIENISAKKWSIGICDLQKWWHRKLQEKGFGEIAETAEKTYKSYSDELNQVKESRLLHMEFDLRNLLVQEDDIAVLDWEVSCAGDPMLDMIATEKRLIWRENEDQEIAEAFRNGYRSQKDIKITSNLEELYEMFQMTRFLLIFNKDEEMRKRIENRLQELFESLEKNS